MGVQDCATFAMAGGRTPYDIIIGQIEWAMESVKDAEMPVEFHPGDGPAPEEWSVATSTEEGVVPHVMPHFLDRKQDLLERLSKAKEQVDEVWYLVLEAIEMV